MSLYGNNKRPVFQTLALLLILLCAAVVSTTPVSAETGVTVIADGDHSYYQGEKVVLRGQSPDADTVYLFMTGPKGVVPAAGGKLTSPHQGVVSGNPDSFTVVKTKPDKTWEYAFYTANLNLDAGTYTIYAAGEPKAVDQLGPGATHVGMALKKPFITAEISSSNVVKGQPFLVTGTAEGGPPAVQLWIIGDNYVFNTTVPVNSDASYRFTADAAISGNLPKGPYYLIAQHSMQDNKFDIVRNGDYVRNLKLNSGTNVFKIAGPGSLQGNNAADALIAAISDQEPYDDTHTIVPFQVTDTTTAPVQSTTQHAPLEYAGPIGAGALVIVGIVLWKRH